MIHYHVFGDSLEKLCRLVEDFRPLGNLFKVVLEVGAAGGRKGFDHTCKGTEIFKSVDDVATREVSVNLFSHLFKV